MKIKKAISRVMDTLLNISILFGAGGVFILNLRFLITKELLLPAFNDPIFFWVFGFCFIYSIEILIRFCNTGKVLEDKRRKK